MTHSTNKHTRSWQLATLTIIILTSALLMLFATQTASAASTAYINGLVFIDENRNGTWDAGEPGYGGAYDVREVEAEVWEWAYYGTEVSFTYAGGDPADGDTLMTAGYADDDEDGNALCTAQDLDEEGSVTYRPCEGTFGYIVFADGETWWDVAITVPDGYEATSDTTVTVGVTAGNGVSVDFGIAPIEVDTDA